MGMTASSGNKKQPEPEINVTPLVDIVLVLLIIFMVVTPAMNEGEAIELPKLASVDEKTKELHPIEVTMAQNGRILVDQQLTKSADVLKVLTKMHEADPEKMVRLNADARLEYKIVRDTFKSLQDVGFKGVQLKVVEKQ